MVKIVTVEEGSSKASQHHSSPHCTSPRQEYELSCGAEVKIKAGQEVQRNFTLEYSQFKDCGTVSGIVKNKYGHLIHNALIKVFDTHHNPVAHVFTNQEGQFLISLPPGGYIIKAVK